MRASVRAIFVVPFTESFEGGVPCCYVDIRGKVTIAYGNLVDTPGEVAALPLVRADGSLASIAEKIALWNVLHDDPHAARGGWTYAAKLSPLRLPREAMTALALRRLDTNNAELVRRLPEFEDFNGCAQLALHSWAWAGGADDPYPHMFAALRGRNFASYTRDSEGADLLTGGAALEIFMKEVTPEGLKNNGLVPRNVANRLLMRNAQRIDDYKLDPDLIEWKSLIGVSDVSTVPAIENPASSPTIHPDPHSYLDPSCLDSDPPDEPA